MIEILPGERLDDLILGGLKLIQKPKGFCFSIDAVLLSHFVALDGVTSSIDLGTGSGVIPLLLTTRKEDLTVTGLEIQKEYVEMGQRSIALNTLQDRVEIVWGNIKDVQNLFKGGSFDLVLSNPPYMPIGCGKESDFDAKRIARHEVLCNLKDVVAAARYLVGAKGNFGLVHRAERLAELLALMQSYNFGNLRIRLVHSFINSEAQLVLVEGKSKGGKKLVIEKPLVIYHSKGVYTEEIEHLYGR